MFPGSRVPCFKDSPPLTVHAQRRIFFVGKSERTRRNAQISILSRIECRNPSSFIEYIQTILPLFQGNIRCLLPVVVEEYLYL